MRLRGVQGIGGNEGKPVVEGDEGGPGEGGREEGHVDVKADVLSCCSSNGRKGGGRARLQELFEEGVWGDGNIQGEEGRGVS